MGWWFKGKLYKPTDEVNEASILSELIMENPTSDVEGKEEEAEEEEGQVEIAHLWGKARSSPSFESCLSTNDIY